jgi:hypothetical protein
LIPVPNDEYDCEDMLQGIHMLPSLRAYYAQVLAQAVEFRVEASCD